MFGGVNLMCMINNGEDILVILRFIYDCFFCVKRKERDD